MSNIFYVYLVKVIYVYKPLVDTLSADLSSMFNLISMSRDEAWPLLTYF